MKHLSFVLIILQFHTTFKDIFKKTNFINLWQIRSKLEEDGESEPEIQYDDSGEYSDITDEQDMTADQSDNIEDNADGDYDTYDSGISFHILPCSWT